MLPGFDTCFGRISCCFENPPSTDRIGHVGRAMLPHAELDAVRERIEHSGSQKPSVDLVRKYLRLVRRERNAMRTDGRTTNDLR